MQTVNRKELDEIFDSLWDEMREEFFKVEVLQYYGEDNGPSLEDWMRGNREKSLEIMRKKAKPWADGKKDVKKIRVHVVDYPLSDYIQWEIEHYKNVNIPLVGEEIYLLDRNEVSNIKLPQGDTMIFDKKKVLSNIYDDSGIVVKAEIYENKEEVKPFLEVRDRLLKLPLEKIE